MLRRSRLGLPLCAALVLGVVSAAQAHDPPRGLALKWASPEADALPLIVANRGLVFADRQGDRTRFSLRCAEGFGASVADDPGVFFERGDSLAVSVYSGTAHSSDRACTLQPATGLSGTSFGSVVQDVASPSRMYVPSRTVDMTAALFVSVDYGRSWSVHFTNRVGEYYDALLTAPSDARRLYASGRRVDHVNRKLLYLSSATVDGGKTWVDTAFETKLTPFAVHPHNADVVFAHEATDALETAFRLLRSDDAGLTYTSVLEGIARPHALTGSDAGAPLWLALHGAGGQGGLYRSDDDGLHFERVHADSIQQASCLAARDGRLWLCANMAPNTNGVWFSEDGGASFQPFMTFADVTDPVTCDGEAQALCARAWLDFDSELHRPTTPSGSTPDAGAAAPAPMVQAAPQEPVPAEPGGGCRIVSSARAGLQSLDWIAIMTCMALVHRRRYSGTTTLPQSVKFRVVSTRKLEASEWRSAWNRSSA